MLWKNMLLEKKKHLLIEKQKLENILSNIISEKTKALGKIKFLEEQEKD